MAAPSISTRSAESLRSAKRILVLGPSGSGKTQLALRLGALLGLEIIHLDAHFWQPGWISTPQADWREKIVVLARREAWIMDGTYESTLDLRIRRADTAVLIEDNRWNCLIRAVRRRMVADRGTRPDAPPGQKLDIPFLRYIWNYSTATRPVILEQLREHGASITTITLQGRREVQGLLREMELRTRGTAPD